MAQISGAGSGTSVIINNQSAQSSVHVVAGWAGTGKWNNLVSPAFAWTLFFHWIPFLTRHRQVTQQDLLFTAFIGSPAQMDIRPVYKVFVQRFYNFQIYTTAAIAQTFYNLIIHRSKSLHGIVSTLFISI